MASPKARGEEDLATPALLPPTTAAFLFDDPRTVRRLDRSGPPRPGLQSGDDGWPERPVAGGEEARASVGGTLRLAPPPPPLSPYGEGSQSSAAPLVPAPLALRAEGGGGEGPDGGSRPPRPGRREIPRRRLDTRPGVMQSRPGCFGWPARSCGSAVCSRLSPPES